jgi:hypothetical protein
MKCYSHPDRDSVTHCITCEKPLCSGCTFVEEDQNYCKDCIKKRKYPVEIKKIILPALACGDVAGFLSAAPLSSLLNCVLCLWIVVGGALTVYLVKKIYTIKGKISAEKAALTGSLTGVVARLVMWVILRSEIFDLIHQLSFLFTTLLIPFFDQRLIYRVVIRTVLFALFGGLGGVISNELA